MRKYFKEPEKRIQKIKDKLKGHLVSVKTRKKISDSVKKYFFEHPGIVSKENHPQWRDGSSSLSYSREFSVELKEKIRKRDNYKCQKCWKIETEHERNRHLEIHHIDYNKENNSEDNLITLCRSCHAKTNFSREDWISHFQELLKKPKIFISVLNEGFIKTELVFALIKWLKETEYRVYLEMPSERPIENNRNQIVKRFLSSDASFLLQIDNDNVPARNPLELVDLNLDIISCPVWIYQYKLLLNIYRWDGEYYIPVDYETNKNKDLIEIDATGAGVILCSRNALERLERPFERIYDDKGLAIQGLDLAFSEKAKKAGFKIYSHLDYMSKHYKTIDLSEFVNK